jgi:hypothetical protein
VPRSSDVNLFGYGEGIIDFDAEIPDSALDFCLESYLFLVVDRLLKSILEPNRTSPFQQ